MASSKVEQVFESEIQRIRAARQELIELDGASLGDVLIELATLQAALDATAATARAEWEASLAWAVDGASSPTAWLKQHTGQRGGSLRRQGLNADLVRRHPAIGLALAAGSITLDHVALLRGILNPRTRAQFVEDLDQLVEWAGQLPADQFVEVCRQWLSMADIDGADDQARKRYERRRLHLSQLPDGNWKLDAILSPADGAALSEAITQLAAEQLRAEQQARQERASEQSGDDRSSVDAQDDEVPAPLFGEDSVSPATAPQARADALAELVRRGTAVDLRSTQSARPSLSLVIDEASLRSGGDAVTAEGAFVPGPTVERIVCDCDIHAVITNSLGEPVDLGRAARLATAAQRRAVVARDRHCQFPGCDRLPSWCRFHHLVWWSRGGTTDVSNLALVCEHHHHLVHEGGWDMWRDRSGSVRVAPPGVPRGQVCPAPDRLAA